MIVGVVCWNSDKADEPEVFVGDTADAVRRAVAEWITGYLPEAVGPEVEGESTVEHAEDNDGSINYVDGFWVRENPPPNLDDPEAVTAWLAAFKEQTTDCWLDLYGEGEEYGFTDQRAPLGTHLLAVGSVVNGFTFIGPVIPDEKIVDEYIETVVAYQGLDWNYVKPKSLAKAIEDWKV